MKTKRRKSSKKKSPMNRKANGKSPVDPKAGPLCRQFTVGERLMGQTELHPFQARAFNAGVIKQLWREHRMEHRAAVTLMCKKSHVLDKCFQEFKNYSDTANALVKAEG